MSPRYYLLDTSICIHYLKEFGIATRVRMVGLENCFLKIAVAEPAGEQRLDVAALRHSCNRVLSISPHAGNIRGE
jgi:hypothetical protein